MTYNFLVFLIFGSLLLKEISVYYNFFNIDIYLFLIPVMVFKIIKNIKSHKIEINKPIFFFILYIFSIFISLLINNTNGHNNLPFLTALKGTISYSLWPLIFLLTATERFTTKKSISLNKLLWIIGYIMALNTLVPIVIYYTLGITFGEFIVDNDSFRSFGFLTDQVGFALVYFVILSINEKKYLKLLIFLVSISVTGTRGAIIFAVVAMITTFVFQKKSFFSLNQTYNIFKRGVVVILILIATWISFGEKIRSLVILRFDKESVDSTSEQRIGAISSGLALFLENPIFGVGYGKFSELVYNRDELSNNFDYHSTITKEENMRGYANAQNEVVNVLVNGGLFSLIMVVLFVYNGLKNMHAKTRITQDKFQIEAFMFIVLSVFLIQTAVFMFNPGVTSFFFLILLGRGSSKSVY
jgi:O-antigen ligase